MAPLSSSFTIWLSRLPSPSPVLDFTSKDLDLKNLDKNPPADPTLGDDESIDDGGGEGNSSIPGGETAGGGGMGLP